LPKGGRGALLSASHGNTSAKTGTTAHGAKRAVCMGSNSARWCIIFFFFFFSVHIGEHRVGVVFRRLSSSHLNYSKVVFG